MLKNIDHLLYTTSDLEMGMDEIEKFLGVRPVLGGHHPNYGTHNALLPLGESIYLEVIAADTSKPFTGINPIRNECLKKESKLSTWAFKAENIDELTSHATKNGLPIGVVKTGSRKATDGTVLSWKLVLPNEFICDGTIPFLINWGNTPHPATVVPKAGELIGLEIEHPNPKLVSKNLNILGANIPVNKAEKPKLIAKIKTKYGIVILE